MSVAVSVPASVPSDAGGFHGSYLRGDTAALRFLPRHVSREADWEARIEEVRARLPAGDVWERAARAAEALGADESSLAGAGALRSGDAICVTTGQQPGLFLGPLYTVYKALTAIALARRVERRSGFRAVPVFWSAADDSDFGEVGTAVLPDADLRLKRYSLDGGELASGGMVGDLETSGTAKVLADTSWRAHVSGERVRRSLEHALERSADHGELTSAVLYDLFAGTGLVVVDGRWPELRRQAAPLFARYAERQDEAARVVRRAGSDLEKAGFRVAIRDASTTNALFDIETGRRLPFEGGARELLARAHDHPETLSPNVMLRPLVQDSLFPNVATVAGPGEISYHAQLAPEYELLETTMPVLFPRLEATLVPEGVFALAERRGASVEDFVRDFDGAMKETADAALPDGLRATLESLQRGWEAEIENVRHEAERFDEKLTGAVAETSRRATEAIRKLREQVARAARSAEIRRDPAVKTYREFLRPRGVAQERVLSSLLLFLDSTDDPVVRLESVLEEHLAAAQEMRPRHWLLGGFRLRGEEGS
jgi:bacillithiol biosynthesis cysteine-adding enzyme BshC